jgi:hypothetical protein
MKLDDFHLPELLKEARWREAVNLVAIHYGRDPSIWSNIEIAHEISGIERRPDSMYLVYPYNVRLSTPGHYYDWHSIWGWCSGTHNYNRHEVLITVPWEQWARPDHRI